MKQLYITDFKNQDIEKITEIEERSSYNHWTQKMLIAEYQNKLSNFKIAYLDKIIIGYIIYRILIDEAEILNIVVDITSRGNHFGKDILKYAIKDMKIHNVKNIFLEVGENNIAAQNLYTSIDFIKFGTRQNYYANECAILMKKKI